MFQTRGQSSQTQQAAMRTYTKAGLVGLALLSSAEVRDSGTQSPMSPRLRVRKTPEGWSPRPHAHLLLFLPGIRRKGRVAAATTHTDVPTSNLGRPH